MKITPAALDAVIEKLEVKFPNEIPVKATTTDVIHMMIGNQQVLKYLKELRESL
jgi:hypothetical protein